VTILTSLSIYIPPGFVIVFVRDPTAPRVATPGLDP